MLKRCLLAVIVALLVTSSQIAAEDYDWSQAPRFGTITSFASYVENCRRRGQTNFHVILTNSSILPSAWQTLYIDKNDLANIIPCRDYEPLDGNRIDKENEIFIFKLAFRVIEYPGTKVANAYLSSNQQQAWMNLNHEEQDLFNIAVGIVDEANKRSSEREKAEYIHDEICRMVYDYKDENERNKTAIGALIDHYAQCQGFSDAFYMLGRMSGLKVGRTFGTADGGGHAWNFITFSDGKSYCVDVTNGFNTKSSLYLWTFERMKNLYSCEWEIIPNLQ